MAAKVRSITLKYSDKVQSYSFVSKRAEFSRVFKDMKPNSRTFQDIKEPISFSRIFQDFQDTYAP